MPVRDSRNRNKHAQDSIRNPDKRMDASKAGVKHNNRRTHGAHGGSGKPKNPRRSDPANEIIVQEENAEKDAAEAAEAAVEAAEAPGNLLWSNL